MSVEIIRSWVKLSLGRKDEEIFPAIVDRLETEMSTHKSGGQIAEIKGRNMKEKGDLWEAFCVLYLQAHGYTVFRLADTPQVWVDHLKLKTDHEKKVHDSGIDLVAGTPGTSQPVAIQCKYRHVTGKHNKFNKHGKTLVTWQDLSTFYAMCARTGPWCQHLVMTNCHGVNRKGQKTPKDATMARLRFTNTPRDVWLKIAGSVGQTIGHSTDAKNSVGMVSEKVATSVSTTSTSATAAAAVSNRPEPTTQKELRERRAAYFTIMTAKKS